MTVRLIIELVLVIFVITQVALPLAFDTPMFPLFRRRKRDRLLSDLEHARQTAGEDALMDELSLLHHQHEEHIAGLGEEGIDAEEGDVSDGSDDD